MEFAIKFRQKVLDENFMEFVEGEVSDPDEYLYCQDWAMNYAI